MKTQVQDYKLLVGLVFFSLSLLFFDRVGFLNPFKSLAQTVTVPVQFGLYKSVTSFGQSFQFIFVARQAYLENEALKQQLGELLTENSSLRTKLSENETLVDQYNKLSPVTYDLMPVHVIGSGRFLTLDRGLDDGITAGQVVVYKDNYIGQIKEASPKTSRVLLPFDPDSKIAVFSQGSEGRARGILQGQFGSELLMDKILHQENVAEGDLVYSEGMEGRLPKGLVMGKVSEVLEKENEIFKQAKVVPLFNAVDLDTVFVMKSP